MICCKIVGKSHIQSHNRFASEFSFYLSIFLHHMTSEDLDYWETLPSTDDGYYNNSPNTSCSSHGQLHEILVSKIFFLIVYSTIMVVALAGNGLVVYVVVTNKAMQTVTNLFITNLAVSDLLVNLSSLWMTPTYTYLNEWVWGEYSCHALPLIQGASIFISSLTLTTIAIDRFTVIVHPFHRRMSIPVCYSMIIFIWILSLMLVAPYAVHMKLGYKPCGNKICEEAWAYTQIQVVYGVIVLTLQFAVPFTVISVCYSLIWRHMTKSQKRTGRRSDADARRKRRMFKMLVGMVLMFAMCWLPPNVINIVKDTGVLGHANYFVFIYLVGHATAMSSSMWNPLIYAFLNENFRREFTAVLSCFGTSQGRVKRVYSFSKLQRTDSNRRRIKNSNVKPIKDSPICLNNNNICRESGDPFTPENCFLTVALEDAFSSYQNVSTVTNSSLIEKTTTI